MIALLSLSLASADLQTLAQAVDRCDRDVANPAFAGENARRSRFLLDAFLEQEAIIVARSDTLSRRRLLREASSKDAAAERQLQLTEAVLEDRQRALNDRRLLENIRRETMDSMRTNFVAQCVSGRREK